MDNINQGLTSTNPGKKTWTMPELIVIDKKVIKSGQVRCTTNETSTYCGSS